MSQFELETRYQLHSPGGAVRLAAYRSAAYSTVVGLFVLLATGWLDRRIIRSGPAGVTQDQLDRTGLDLYLSQWPVLILYVAALVLAAVRPPQHWTTLVAAGTGLVIVLATLPLAIDDHTTGDTRYDDTWSPVIGVVIVLWLALGGIAFLARRAAR
ncbi:hypothetical protein [Kribbella sp. CA-293567]|uniref:hypothetical protein n=1 Tax=Kribbella sp. CA-293567 TaxID=3002436 RepID=UPI0022DE77A3|nr:hypothetical protein [Kribbella sp. CA-293567]WBQ06128.1 hypothetical protein OX958_04825 [Kribbella sp. CA-293567]